MALKNYRCFCGSDSKSHPRKTINIPIMEVRVGRREEVKENLRIPGDAIDIAADAIADGHPVTITFRFAPNQTPKGVAREELN